MGLRFIDLGYSAERGRHIKDVLVIAPMLTVAVWAHNFAYMAHGLRKLCER